MPSYLSSHHSLLARTFIHLDGMGPKTERHLWRNGIRSWPQLRQEVPKMFSALRAERLLRSLDATEDAWARDDLYYFHRSLPGDERWRMIEGGYADIAYFDIEASGGGMPPQSSSTAIAFLFRGEILQAFEKEEKRRLVERMRDEAAIFCTYNGATYDLPFLAKEFQLDLGKAHIDLCPWLRRVGLQGGLKAIQKSLPNLPQRLSLDIDGYDAVRLWRYHEEGMSGALETLLAYNAEDVLILPHLLVHAYAWEAEQRPYLELSRFEVASLPLPATEVDPKVYAHLKALPRGARPSDATSPVPPPHNSDQN